MTYTFGAAAVTDTSGSAGPDAFSALDMALEVDLNVPAGATGSVVTVTTAGGSATLTLADVPSSVVAAEPQGSGALDGVGGTLATAYALAVGPNSRSTVTGRIDPAADVDLYRLVGAEAGGILSLSATGAQGSYARFRLFDGSGNVLSGPVASLSQLVLPSVVGGAYYLGYTGYPNQSYSVVDGTGVGNAYNVGDYSLSIRYAAPGVTSLNSIVATAASGVSGDATIASANTGQGITIEGEGFTGGTRVRFATFNSDYPQNGLGEREVAPSSVAADGQSLTVVVPDDAVTGVVRLVDEPAGLILQVVPTVADVDMTSASFDTGSNLRVAGGGLIEGAQTLIMGTAVGAGGATEVQDVWDVSGPNTFNYFCTPAGCVSKVNAGADFQLPLDAPTGPVRVKTLGGSSAPFAITLTGISADTAAARGTPAVLTLPSANARQAITLLGSGFDAYTEVVFPIQQSGQDVPTTRVVSVSQVAADGSSLQVVVPDDAMTGTVRVVGAGGGFFLQIVPTIVQVVPPGTFATGQTFVFEGSGYIENDVTIGLGNTTLLDTGAFYGPDEHNRNITLVGQDRSDNDGIALAVPPGAANGPYMVRTTGGTARMGVVIDLGTVIHEVRPGRIVGGGEQELFKTRAAVEGWLDLDLHFSFNFAEITILNADGTPATPIESTNTATDAHRRVATQEGQLYTLIVNGLPGGAAYDLTVINHDRFDDPVGPQSGLFSGNYGSDPDGPNDTAATATDFTPAVYVLEPRLTVWSGDRNWFTWKARATGQMSVATQFTPAAGKLSFRVYADSDNDGVLSALEAASPVATGTPVSDGASASGIAAALGQRFWAEVFSVDGNSDGVLDKNVYTFTFSNVDRSDAGLLAGHPAPNNDTQANAVDLGRAVSWNSKTLTDFLTIHKPTDQDWFRLKARVPGSIQVMVDMEQRQVGQVNATVVDAASGAPLSLVEFEDLGSRLRFKFSPVAKEQSLLVKFDGQPNAYTFAIQNHDLAEPNPAMAEPAILGLVVSRRLVDLSLPGLPDAGTRDDDWFKFVTAASDSRLDVQVTPDPAMGRDVTVRIWQDKNANLIPEQALGELLARAHRWVLLRSR